MASFRPFSLKGYSPFKTVQSGRNGTVKGALDLESDAEAFVYAKEITVSTGWFLHRSSDGGRNFERVLDAENKPLLIWGKEIRTARMILDAQADAVLTAAVSGFDVLFKRITSESEISTLAGRLTRKEDMTPVLRNGKIHIIGQESGLLFSSTDKGANFQKEGKEETVNQPTNQ